MAGHTVSTRGISEVPSCAVPICVLSKGALLHTRGVGWDVLVGLQSTSLPFNPHAWWFSLVPGVELNRTACPH